MIFVSVGSMMPFDRLVRAMDAWAAAHPDQKVFIQIGNGAYVPQHASHARLVPVSEYRKLVAESALFVAHAGMGSIIAAIQAGKPLLMLPRLRAQGEHNTDHQVATARNVGNRPGLLVAVDEADLAIQLDRLLTAGAPAPAPISPFASDELIANVRAFIQGKR